MARRRIKRYPWPWQAYLALGFERHALDSFSRAIAPLISVISEAAISRSFRDALYPHLLRHYFNSDTI